MTTLSQRMQSFLAESRAEILPRCRRDYPLSPAINKGWFYGMREEKSGSKISQKISFSPVFLPANVLSSLSLSRCFFSPWRPHRNIPPPPKDGVSASLRTQILTGDRHSHHEVFSLLSANSLLLHLFLSSFATSGQHYHHSSPEHQLHHRKPARPPTDYQAATATLSLFSFQPFSLLCNVFFFFSQLTPATVTSAESSWATGQTSSARQRPPNQTTFSSLRCLLLRRGRCMQNSFMHAVAE